MAYINKDSSEYKLFEEENQKNKSLLSCIRKYTTKNNSIVRGFIWIELSLLIFFFQFNLT